MTDEQHNRYIAWSFLAHAGFQLLMLIMIVAIFSVFLFVPIEPGKPGPPPKAFFGVMIAFMTVFQLLFAAPSMIAAYGLLKRKSWARIASIVAAVISAMNVPIGTAACVYSLWFFLGENWKSVYPEKACETRQPPSQIAYGTESQRAAYEAEANTEKTFDAYNPPDWR